MSTSVFSSDIWLQFALITRILPFWISLLIASLAGDWLLRNTVPTLSTFPAIAISSLMLSLAYQNLTNHMTNQHFLKKSLHSMNNSMHFQLSLMLFPKHNSPITRFNSALQTMTQTSKQESSNKHHWYTSKEKSQSLPTFTPMYSPGITKTYFIQVLTECFKPSHNISVGPAYAHKLKTSWSISTLANITRHKERSMDTYLFQTNNKLLTCGTQLQSIPLDHGSFCSCHILQNQKSLQHFKHIPSLTSTCTSWKLWHCKTRKASPLLTPLTKFGSASSIMWNLI